MLTAELTKRQILIAERDRNVRELEAFALEAAGYSIEFVDDGESALAYATSNATVLIITEILIPRLDGLTLCRRLREQPGTRDVPVLVFSILAAAARAEEAGATAFLRKPFIQSSFVATVSLLATPQEHVMTEVR
jgi:CheY-like chemotaxis protein